MSHTNPEDQIPSEDQDQDANTSDREEVLPQMENESHDGVEEINSQDSPPEEEETTDSDEPESPQPPAPGSIEEAAMNYSPPFNPSEHIKWLEKAEAVARSYHWIFLGAAAYSITTYFTTNDKSILLNDEIVLPLIGLPVPSWAFFFLTPVLLFGISMYFHLALNRVLNGIDQVVKAGDPSTEFRPLWIITRSYYEKLVCPPEERTNPEISLTPSRDRAPESLKFRSLSRPIVVLFLWAPLPAALVLNFIQQVKIHSLFHSIFSNIMLVLGLSAMFYLRKRYLRRRIASREITFYISIFIIFCLGFIVSGAATDSEFGGFPGRVKELFCLDVSNTILSEQPKEDYPEIPWLVLSNRNLNGIDMQNSVVVRTDFRNSNIRNGTLRKAYLFQSDLRGVDVEDTDLREVFFDKSDLSGLQLTGMDLTGASFKGADLTNVNFGRSNLTNADFEGAIVQGTRFDEACLKGANLSGIIDQNNNLWETLTRCQTLDDVTLEPHIRDLIESSSSFLFFDFDPKDLRNKVVFWDN